MTKNKLEKKFSESFKCWGKIWGMKLHNNMLAHQTTPADYMLTQCDDDRLRAILVEAKQVTCENGKGRLNFKRLKQLHSLLNFRSINHWHFSFFLIAYYDNRWANSDIYMVPATFMDLLVKNHHNVSLSREDARRLLIDYKLEMEGGIIRYPKQWELYQEKL